MHPTPPPAFTVAPTVDDPTAVIGRRIVAWLVDVLIVIAAVVLVMMATFTNTSYESTLTAQLQCDVINDLSDDSCINFGTTVFVGTAEQTGLASLAWLGAFILVTMLIPGRIGASPGKVMLGLRIVNKDTFERAGIGPNIVRTVLWMLDAFPYGAPLVGLAVGTASKGHRRLGDMAAGTLVIRADHVGRPVSLPGVNTVAPPAPLFASSPPPPPAPAAPPPPSFPVAPPTATPPPPAPGVSPVGGPPPPPASAEPFAYPPPPADPPLPDSTHYDPPPVADIEISDDHPPFVAPQSPPAPTPEPVQPASPPGVDAPVWDDARATYIQWDPELNQWMEWSSDRSQWVPIST